MKKLNSKSKNRSILFTTLLLLFILTGFTKLTKAQAANRENCVYFSSLHASAHGMSYWYSKEQGGLESVTGIPYEQVGCTKCHVNSCDECHKTNVNGKPGYSTDYARSQTTCMKCHARESAMIVKVDKAANTPDVHFKAEMTCMDCHTAREIHGDSTLYKSMKEPGAMDVTCEQCHDEVSDSKAHTVHGDKLDCKACHVRHVISCNNCHVETMLKEKKRVAQSVSGWKFLMNYEGKVTSANMQTFVAPGDKTFMIFAPQFSHSVKKEGDKCEDCHGSANVKKVAAKEINLTWLENGAIVNTKGIIPVVDGVTYNTSFQNHKNGVWTPIENPVKPKLQYVGFGTPLSMEQLEKLEKTQN